MNRNERRARARQDGTAAAVARRQSKEALDAEEVVRASHRLFELGRIREALPGLLRTADGQPDHPGVVAALAYALASTGRVGPAIERYRHLLDLQPDSVPVLTNLALLMHRVGRLEDSQRLLERAGALAPEHANTAFALAELLDIRKKQAEAFHQYRRAVVLFERAIGPRPDIKHCNDLVKMASALMWTGDVAAALANFDRAVALRPDHALALARRGLALGKIRRTNEAIESLKRAAAVEPGFAEVRRAIGDLLLQAGKTEAAQPHYRAALRINPRDTLAAYFLAAARKSDSPEAPPPGYIETLFDDYAQRFEHHLVDVLQYRAPELVCEAVLTLAGPSARDWSVIDLGCGTGLCGPLIRHVARRLVGVDLSEAMLDKAREKSVYDELRQGDIVAVLAEQADAFDLALSTDVLIYLGDLGPVFRAAASGLKPGGLFALTVEAYEGQGYLLDKTGRYLHARDYVEKEAASSGLNTVSHEPIVARYQGGAPVTQHMFIMRRGDGRQSSRFRSSISQGS